MTHTYLSLLVLFDLISVFSEKSILDASRTLGL